MAFKPGSSRIKKGDTRVNFAEGIKIPIQYDERTLRRINAIKEDSDLRLKIQGTIRELKKKGLTEDETLAEISILFQDSEYKRFFKSWIENVYAKKTNRVGSYGAFEER